MREFDVDSAKRKFENTLMFYETPEKTIQHGYCYRIIVNNGNITYLINPNILTEHPLYQLVPNGFYTNELAPNGYTLIIRRPDKTFKIGICTQTHWFVLPDERQLTPNKRWEHTNLQDPLPITQNTIESALKNTGPISRTLWLSPTNVYYLNRKVGNRKGTKFLVNNSIKHHLETILTNFKPTFWA